MLGPNSYNSRLALAWNHTCNAAQRLAGLTGHPLGLADTGMQVADWLECDAIRRLDTSWPRSAWLSLHTALPDVREVVLPGLGAVTVLHLVGRREDAALVAILSPAAAADLLPLLPLIAATAEAELGQRLAQERWGAADDRTVSAMNLIQSLFPSETTVNPGLLPRMCRTLLESIANATSFHSALIRLGRSFTEEGVRIEHELNADLLEEPDLLEQVEQQSGGEWINVVLRNHDPAPVRAYALPLISAAGHSLGAMVLFPGPGIRISDEDVETARMMAGIGAGIIAAALVRTRDRLLNYLSHEVNSPLSRAKSSLEQLLNPAYGPLTEKQERIAERALQACVEATHTAETLLTAARQFAGRLPYCPAVHDVGEVLEELRREHQQSLTDWGLTLECRAVTGTRIFADPHQLRLILRNLVGNAIKFSEPGGHISVAASPTPQGTRIQVDDNGPGIDPAQVEQIWQPFSRLIGTSEIPGSGIGLTLVKELLERHGGSIKVSSPPQYEQGTRFTLTFPKSNNRSAQ